ncbi:Flp pilus assembly complex ATPase component TadA [Candidatus Woesearchaeota archaeon]|nr:Flp pilus assembly complex ATPase component TadA [Candidatus Woesearchaeota archaeon]
MPFEPKKEPYSYDLIREGEETTLRIDCEKLTYIPSLEDNAMVMSKTIEILIETGTVSKIVFVQKRDYEYDFYQTQLLLEITDLFKKLAKRKDLFSYAAMGLECQKWFASKYSRLQLLFFRLLKEDPLGAFVELRREHRRGTVEIEKTVDKRYISCQQKYIALLDFLIKELDTTRLISIAKPYLPGYKLGDRSAYRRIFRPTVKPDFMFTKLMAEFPEGGEEIGTYTVSGKSTEITVFKLPDSVQYLYHLMPPEFRLSEEKYEIIDLARKIMAEHKPKKQEFVEPERMRAIFHNVGRDLIEELSERRNIRLRERETDELAEILVRYTVGFGLIEVLLQDPKIQDVTINSPMGLTPMFIVHAEYGDCTTNIVPTTPESESWASKLRMISGRPLDEANPILDTEIEIPGARARVGIIAPPLNPFGLAYAFRRHRDKPWTLPLFIKARMIDPLAAGLLSFVIDGTRTMLVAGTRSAGKSSLLGAILVEIMRRYRIITVEDTLELPVGALRKLNYNIQQMKVRSALAKGGAEVPADVGIRTSLRLGDSALFIGEVRSTEALALYEAMRVGAMANVVAGTIHGESPYGVFDRVVNDLKVPRTSFKATDLVVVANPIRSPDGIHKWRRVTQITEVRKEWEKDPMLEHGFVDLMKYDAATDKLQPSDDLMNGDSDLLKAIAGNVKEWAGNWDAVWDNIQLRAKIKETLVKASEKANDPDMLEATFAIATNDAFHKISEEVREEVGALDSKRIFFNWNEWLKRTLKKRTIK